jgi:hypothetical protein
VPLTPPQISHDLTRNRTRAVAVGSRWIAWGMTRPSSGNALHLYLEGARIESVPRYPDWGFRHVSQSLKTSAGIVPLPFPLRFLLIHDWSIIVTFDAMQSSYWQHPTVNHVLFLIKYDYIRYIFFSFSVRNNSEQRCLDMIVCSFSLDPYLWLLACLNKYKLTAKE